VTSETTPASADTTPWWEQTAGEVPGTGYGQAAAPASEAGFDYWSQPAENPQSYATPNAAPYGGAPEQSAAAAASWAPTPAELAQARAGQSQGYQGF
jgi:hypothetical protein